LFPVKIDSKVFILLGLGSTVLLFAGLLDDIVGLKVSQRFIIQTLVTFVVVFKATIFITSMNGLFGVHELSKITSLILSILIYVIFTNILNLIDGIDGLAAGVSILAFFFFASVAYISGNYLNILISMVSLGSLIPFLYFNILSKKKIFLGDNGSLVLGFVLGYFTLNFLSETNSFGIYLLGDHTILILMCLFSYPLVDTLRVFTIRISRGRSPFLADKNHIHHHLLRLGFSHRKATLFILLFTISITSLSFFLTRININIAFVVLFFLAVFVICLPSFLIKKDEGLILKKNMI
jgi:UDP-GlcNAc:undecaprenyl-phosphate GlcNAc-1-phosphate transferase